MPLHHPCPTKKKEQQRLPPQAATSTQKPQEARGNHSSPSGEAGVGACIVMLTHP